MEPGIPDVIIRVLTSPAMHFLVPGFFTGVLLRIMDKAIPYRTANKYDQNLQKLFEISKTLLGQDSGEQENSESGPGATFLLGASVRCSGESGNPLELLLIGLGVKNSIQDLPRRVGSSKYPKLWVGTLHG